MNLKRLLLSAALSMSALLGACGGGGSSPASTTSTYQISGTLTGLSTGTTVVLQNNGRDNLSLTGNGPFAFATQIATGSSYAITIQTQPLHQTCTVSNGNGTVGSSSVTNIAVNCVADKQFAYVTNQGDNTVSAYEINPSNGALTPLPSSPVPTGSSPSLITVNPANTFAYVTNGNNAASTAPGSVSAYSINKSTGALTPVPGSPFAAGVNPIGVTVNPAGTYAYVVNNGGTSGSVQGTISVYSINPSTGALTPIQGSPFPAGNYPGVIAISPNGSFAYVTNYGGTQGNVPGTISVYAVNKTTGALTPIQGSPFAAGVNPGYVALNPAGTYAYVTNNGDNTISVYSINQSTGALTPIQGSPFPAGNNPGVIAISPNGAFAYVTNGADNTVTAYSIDPNTGALSQIGNPSATGLNPITVALNPAGSFAYVTNENNFSGKQPGSVSAYSVDATTGALTQISASPFPAGTYPISVVVAQP